MQRRQFIKAAASALAMPYIIPASALGRQGAVAPSQRITLGHIGCGKIGYSLRGGFAQMADVQVLACCDVAKQRLAEYKAFYDAAYAKRGGPQTGNGIDVVEEYREVLARQDIDAVIISTPDHWHANITIAACRAGKDVYCEKPLTHTVQEAYDVQAAVRRYGRILQTGTQQRSDMNFSFAVEMVRNGRIGKVHTVNINTGGAPQFKYNLCGEPQNIFNWDRWIGPSAVQPYNSIIAPPIPSEGGWAGWRGYSDFGGGSQCDWGAHMYDIAQWGLGRDGDAPVHVIPAEPGNPEKQNLTYLYADGVKMVRSRNTHFKELNGGLEFIGDKGVIYVERGQLVSDPGYLTSEPISGTEATVYRSSDHKRDFINGVKTRQRTICNEQVGASSAIVCHLGNIADYIGEPFKFDYKTGLTDNAAANRCLNPPKRAQYTI